MARNIFKQHMLPINQQKTKKGIAPIPIIGLSGLSGLSEGYSEGTRGLSEDYLKGYSEGY